MPFIVCLWCGVFSSFLGRAKDPHCHHQGEELEEALTSVGHPEVPEGRVIAVPINAMCGYGRACGNVPRETLGSELA